LTVFQRATQKVAVRRRQQHVEESEAGGRRRGQAPNARLGRMQPHLQRLEAETVFGRNQQLAVDDEGRWRQAANNLHHVWEVTVERLAGLGLEPDLIARSEC
jgi:hypothetical protein